MPTHTPLNQKLLDYHIQFALVHFSLFFESHDFTECLKLLMFPEKYKCMILYIVQQMVGFVIYSCNKSEPKFIQVVTVGFIPT